MARGQVIRAILDANVLYAAFLRDVLLRLAAGDLFHPHWTKRIHDEWIRNLAADRTDLPRSNLVRTAAEMDAFFSSALVRDYEALESQLGGVHPGDRHVAAAAVKAGAEIIVTQNLRDFPLAALQPYGLVAMHPDEFIHVLVSADSATARSVLDAHRRGLNRPPLTKAEYRETFIRHGLPRSAALLWP